MKGKRLHQALNDGLAWKPAQAHGLATQFTLPPLARDAVAYTAQNLLRHTEFAIATFGRNVYLSKDTGRTWTLIAERGQSK